MKRILSLVVLAIAMLPLQAQRLTLEECQRLAHDNYPLIRKYDLIRQTSDLDVSNLQKGWLPQVSATAQATLQSDVATLPEALTNVMQQFGYSARGLKKDQYRVGVDVNQTVWEGGTIRNQQQVARLESTIEQQQTDVDLYSIRRRVSNLFFGILLLDDQLLLNADLQTLLKGNLDKLESMYNHGTATQADVNSMRAELQTARQQATDLQSQRLSLCRMLALFIGQEVENVEKPHLAPSHLAPRTDDISRPELSLFDTQLHLADAREHLLRSNLMPRLSVFAQGFYGYPGYDMFHDMMHRNPTLNGMVGARLSWNIGSLYTNKNNRTKIALLRDQVTTAREVFLFNNRLQQVEQSEAIDKYLSLLKADDEIISLRQSVRLAAESKLQHGIIDVTNLLQEITRENQSRIQRSLHEIQLLQQQYNLQLTLGK